MSDSSCRCAHPSQQAAPFADSEATGTQEDQEEQNSLEVTFAAGAAGTALVAAIAGAIGVTVGGSLADRLAARDVRGYMTMSAITSCRNESDGQLAMLVFAGRRVAASGRSLFRVTAHPLAVSSFRFRICSCTAFGVQYMTIYARPRRGVVRGKLSTRSRAAALGRCYW